MANALITDYSYLKKELESLKSEIWEELVNCSILLNKARKLDKDSYGETFGFLGDLFLDICDEYSSNLKKTKDFHIMLYLNKQWKAQRLLRRLKKILKSLRVVHGQLRRLFSILNLDVYVHKF